MNITIEALQAYLSDRYGGWANEQGLFMKLVEELGEVAEVLNKRAGRKSSDESDLQEELGTELADIHPKTENQERHRNLPVGICEKPNRRRSRGVQCQ